MGNRPRSTAVDLNLNPPSPSSTSPLTGSASLRVLRKVSSLEGVNVSLSPSVSPREGGWWTDGTDILKSPLAAERDSRELW